MRRDSTPSAAKQRESPEPPGTALAQFSLAGQAALVTGAARGLGREIALTLAAAGADVALGLRDATSPDGADLAGQIRGMGRAALQLQMDVTQTAQISDAVNTAAERFGHVDILVNNAGGGPAGPALELSEEDFDTAMAINLKSTFLTAQASARIMAQQGYGRIVNLSSQGGIVALPGDSAYCIAKAAVSHLTRCLAVEWGQFGITVNAVAPTFIRTPGTESVLADPVVHADVIERIAALHRVGEPSEVAGAVAFLASSAATLITGVTLPIDGGWTAR